MTNRWKIAAGLAAAMTLGISGAANAQKAKDHLRIAFVDPIYTVVPYDDPKPENSILSYGVFDSLMCYDPATKELKPLLAESWEEPDPVTIILKLRKDVKFHDGSQMDADDVVYTLKWVTDPKSKYRFARNFTSWMKSVEKIDQWTVKVTKKFPSPLAPLRFAINTAILPSDIHSRFKESAEFGRKSPIGTGPYKVQSFDSTKGVVLVKNPDYPQGNDCKPAGSIGKVSALPIPDMQTQIAKLVTGEVDLLHVSSHGEVELLKKNPMLAVTASQAMTFHYMAIDAAGRSGKKPLQDIRVRKALIHAVNRKLLADNVIPGDAESKPIDRFCTEIQRGCAGDAKPYAYDPAAAKKLLAEAGYPDGFAVEISSTPGSHDLAAAVAGELRKVGVKASVLRLTFGAYRRRQRAGQQQILVGQWTSGGFPDASSTAGFYFNGGARDYWRDKELLQLVRAGVKETDEEKRKQIYGKLFDRVHRQAYILTISTRPDVFVHTKDLVVEKGSLSTYGADLVGMRWKK